MRRHRLSRVDDITAAGLFLGGEIPLGGNSANRPGDCRPSASSLTVNDDAAVDAMIASPRTLKCTK